MKIRTENYTIRTFFTWSLHLRPIALLKSAAREVVFESRARFPRARHHRLDGGTSPVHPERNPKLGIQDFISGNDGFEERNAGHRLIRRWRELTHGPLPVLNLPQRSLQRRHA